MGSIAIMKDMGPVQIDWDGGTLLNPVLGTVTVKSELQNADIKEAGQGEIPVDSVDTGRLVTIEATLTRVQLATLGVVIPGSTVDLVNNNVGVPNSVGNSYYADAKEIILKPLVNNAAETDDETWVTFFKCYPFEKMELGYDNENQRVVLVEFKVYPLAGELYRFGPATP